jgi:hypothetical protein
MKRTILIGILFLNIVTDMNAQQYHPMLDTINDWVYGMGICAAAPHEKHTANSSCGYPNLSFCNNGEIYTGQDTLINAVKYKTIIAGNHSTSSYCLYGFMREDTSLKKIYFKDTANTPELLLYDFSMQVGDTINLQFFNSGSYFENGRYRLDSITAITIQAGARRVFYLSCDTCTQSSGQHILSWVESIGFPGDVIYPYSINEGGFCECHPLLPYMGTSNNTFSQMLNCFEHATKVYYDTAFATPNDTCYYCRFCGGGIPEITSLKSFELAPNPANKSITVSMEISNADNFELYVRDLTGKDLLNKISLGKLGKGSYTKALDISSLSSGFYFLECRNNEGSLFRKLIVQK